MPAGDQLMNPLRLFLLAAGLLVLGFDLARDGSEQIRLRRGIESQQQELRRLREDLSQIRARYNARLLGITWSGYGHQIDESVSLSEIASSSAVDLQGQGSPISLNEHLNLEQGHRD